LEDVATRVSTVMETESAIDAVEDELAAKDAEIAALTRSVTGQLAAYEHPLRQAHLERYSAGRIAALEAEIAELRKRPTLGEIIAAVQADEFDDEVAAIGRLYAEKARAEAPK